MFKIILLLLCMTLSLFGTSQSVTLDCTYTSLYVGSLKSIYGCQIRNSPPITSLDDAEVDAITGKHWNDRNNDNVIGLTVAGLEQIHYFPRGIDKFFKNLKYIQFYYCSIKEIHQSDLKPFPNLQILSLHTNHIERLEKDLFEFNPKLEYITFEKNNISYIDPNVFDKLTNLTTLGLEENTCINLEARDSAASVQHVIKTAKTHCTPGFITYNLY